MTFNPKDALLRRLAEGDVMHGWGAILAFDQARLNDLLEQQYLAAFNDLSFLMPMNASFTSDSTDEERMTVEGLVFGVPRVSFEQASLTNAKVNLTMNIIAGTSTTMLHLPGRPPQLLRALTLREEMGYHLKMTVDLRVRTGQIGGKGRLLLDLTGGEEFTCNIGQVPEVARRIGQILGASINAHPAYRQMFVTAMLDLNDYGPLAPTSFVALTQPHPASNDKDAGREGEGAVVLFCQLRMNEKPGGLPANGDDFPYLIPDDLSPEGGAAVNSALLVAGNLRKFISDEAPEIVRQLKLPNDHALQLSESHTPLDWVGFGQIKPTAKTIDIQPRIAHVVAGREQQFTIREGEAKFGTAGPWDATSLTLPQAAGEITEAGVYKAPPRERFQPSQQVTLIYHGQGAQARTALSVETAEALEISPRVASVSGGESIDLFSDPNVSWELLPDQANGNKLHGQLDDQGGGYAVFTAFEPEEHVPEILMQGIRVSNDKGDSGEAVIVVIAYPATLKVEPGYVPATEAGRPIQFRVDGEDDGVTWSKFGEGYIDAEQGLFTPPSEASTIATVIMAEIDARSSGYALVELAPRAIAPPDWTDLVAFNVEVRGTDRCYANGLQQIEVLVTIETNHPDVPLTPVELSTLRFYNVIGNSLLPFIEVAQEGLEPTQSSEPWAVNYLPNEYDRQPTVLDEDDRVHSEFSTSRRRFYLQSSQASHGEFYVKFTKTGGGDFSSKDKAQTVKVVSEAPPAFGLDNYDLSRKRVWNGRGEQIDDDDFSFYLESIDYWKLSCTYQLVSIKFRSCRIVGACSSVRWESEQLDETFFSYLGVAFYPMPYAEPEPPEELSLDGRLIAMAKEQQSDDENNPVPPYSLRKDFIVGEEPGIGELLISLHRVDDKKYWHDSMAEGDETRFYRQYLDQPLRCELRDTFGNLHRVQIGFPPASVVDSRNTLQLTLY